MRERARSYWSYVEGRAAGVRAAHKGGRNKGREPYRVSLFLSHGYNNKFSSARGIASLKIDFDILPVFFVHHRLAFFHL